MDAIAVSPQVGSVALLTDGSHVRIRPAVPGDWQVVHDFAEALGRESVYRRFFGFPRQPGKIIADAVCAPVPPGAPTTHGALLALVGARMVGLAEWHRTGRAGEAEIAFAVSDDLHGRGVATLLAEHLLDAALAVGLRRLIAVTQSDNRAMLDVFTALGVPTRPTWDEGTWLLTIDLDFGAAEREALREAEARRRQLPTTPACARSSPRAASRSSATRQTRRHARPPRTSRPSPAASWRPAPTAPRCRETSSWTSP